MKKFMALYMAPQAAMQQMMKATPEQMKAGMAAWQKWHEKHKTAIVDMGSPLGKTKRVTPAGSADAHNDIGGYSIVQASSADDAAKIFAGHPHFQMGNDAKIELIELMPMPGM